MSDPTNAPTIVVKDTELARVANLIRLGMADDEAMRSIGHANVLAIKSDRDVVHFCSVDLDVIPHRSVRDEGRDRTRRYVVSDETVNRSGDIVKVSGWSFSTMEKNPIVLWSHDSEEPIGLMSDPEKGTHRGRPALMESIDYYEQGLSPKADFAWRLVEAGKMKAVSPGFVPLKVEAGWEMSEKDRKELGIGAFGVVIGKAEQVELSLVTIPRNANALELHAIQDDLRATAEKWVSDGLLDKATRDEFERDLALAGYTVPRIRSVHAIGGLPAPVEQGEALAPTTSIDAPDDVHSLKLALQALTLKHDSTSRQLDELRAVVDRGFDRLADLLPASAPEPTRSSDPRAFYAKALASVTEQLRDQNGRK